MKNDDDKLIGKMCTTGCHIKYDVWWIKYIWKCTGGSHTTHDDKWFLVKCTDHIWLMINDLMIMINGHIMIKVH